MKKHLLKSSLPLLLVLVALSNVIGPIPNMGILYPIAMSCTLAYFIIINKKFKMNFLLLSIVLIAVFSILINDPPSYFRAWGRLGFFIIVIGVISPLIQNQKINIIRLQMFGWLLKLSVIVTTLSFIGYFWGINYVHIREGTRMDPYFGGITTHSMILAPIASVSLLYSTWLVINKKLIYKKNFIAWIIVIVSFFTVLLAASRVAFIAAVIGCLYLILKLNIQHIRRFIKYITIILVVISISFPLWSSFTSRIIQKQKYNTEIYETIYGGRYYQWSNRIEEFLSNPFFGVGFAVVSENSEMDFNRTTGNVEPGSSWLAILSMLGIFGFIPFVWLFGNNLYFLYKDKNIQTSSLLGSVLFFFTIHMFAEGYVLASGSFLFFMLWLTIGSIIAYRETNESFM